MRIFSRPRRSAPVSSPLGSIKRQGRQKRAIELGRIVQPLHHRSDTSRGGFVIKEIISIQVFALGPQFPGAYIQVPVALGFGIPKLGTSGFFGGCEFLLPRQRVLTPESGKIDHLFQAEEMVYLSRLRGEDPLPWQQEFAAAKKAARTKLWDPETQRYWDLDVSTGKLWTEGENLDAYYFLYYESAPARIAAMMKRLNDPTKFNGALLPTLAFDTPKWGGYWRGPSWPREYAHFALALSRSGQTQEAFTWLARGIRTNLGPILPETIDPKKYPREHDISGIRLMGYDALDTAAFPDVA